MSIEPNLEIKHKSEMNYVCSLFFQMIKITITHTRQVKIDEY